MSILLLLDIEKLVRKPLKKPQFVGVLRHQIIRKKLIVSVDRTYGQTFKVAQTDIDKLVR